MNRTAAIASRPWPDQVELLHARDRQVIDAQGAQIDLNAFHDACLTRAAELRQQAIAEARMALGVSLRNAIQALVRTSGRRAAA